MSQEDFQTLLEFYKTLANESRLKILGLVANQERSVEELASLLELKEPTVSHHLLKLKSLNLVQMRNEGNSHLYSLDSQGMQTLNKNVFSAERMAALVDDEVEFDAWEKKVLGNFVEGERLKEIPASHKKRMVILRWLVNHFEPDTRYIEPQVNEMIKRHHADYATLRREFIINKLMDRQDGVYWRTAENS